MWFHLGGNLLLTVLSSGLFVGLQRNTKGIENTTVIFKAGVPHRAGENKPAPGLRRI